MPFLEEGGQMLVRKDSRGPTGEYLAEMVSD